MEKSSNLSSRGKENPAQSIPFLQDLKDSVENTIEYTLIQPTGAVQCGYVDDTLTCVLPTHISMQITEAAMGSRVDYHYPYKDCHFYLQLMRQ